MEPLVKGVEIWGLTADLGALRLLEGSYGGMRHMAEASREKRFAYGKGLPGRTWAERRPLLFKTNSSDFERQRAAVADGVATAISWPIFAGDYLMGVVVFLCGDDKNRQGAIELWHCDTKQSYDMRLLDGYFGTLSRFELISKATSFRKGTGLVGETWGSCLPMLLTDLGRSHRFLRAGGASEAGLTTGLAVPITLEEHQDFVLTFLSVNATPIAQQVEIWKTEPDSRTVRFESGVAQSGANLAARYQGVTLGLHEGRVGQVLLSGIPALTRDISETPAAGLEGLHTAVLVPVLAHGRAKAIVILYGV
jgi:hypothetical protein